jgi:hypothetical protein
MTLKIDFSESDKKKEETFSPEETPKAGSLLVKES